MLRGRLLAPPAARAALRAGPSSAPAPCSPPAPCGPQRDLPSTFFPEIDESMERVYVRLLARDISLDDASRRMREMGKMLFEELPKGDGRAGAHQRGLAEQRPQCDDQPQRRAAHGLHPGRPGRPRAAEAHPARDRRPDAGDSHSRTFQASNSCSGRGAWWRASSPTATSPRWWSRCGTTTWPQLERDAKAVAEVARNVPGVRDVRVSAADDYPEVRVDTERRRGGHGGRHRPSQPRRRRWKRRSATSTRPASGSTPTMVSRTTSSPTTTGRDVPDPNALGELPVRIGADGDAGRPRGLRTHPAGQSVPIAIERNQLQRAAHVLMQTEGRDIGSAASET